tara:strand:- start:209 stop:748 length:540 start_codon:yes stop_codon:yes gene_type:complete
MDIKFEIAPVFRIEFFKIKCVNFENKKEHIEKILDQYPEVPFPNFYSNRDKSNITWELQEIFKDEFTLISAKFNSKILLQRAWSVTYGKGHYHVPHNHSSKGYAGIIYLQQRKDSPKTTYIQPWNNERDKSVLYSPEVREGDMMIVPQFLTHYTEPNKTSFKKRILSFDFILDPSPSRE